MMTLKPGHRNEKRRQLWRTVGLTAWVAFVAALLWVFIANLN